MPVIPRPENMTRKGKGRPKGSQAKVTIHIKEMIEGALKDVGGRQYLAEQAILNPGSFMSLIARILPKEVTVSGDENNPLVITSLTRTIIDSVDK